jgi:hypothetical protein
VIYFIQNTVTNAIKIGYSKNAKKRLNGLQNATPDKLVLLGMIQGGLEHETEFHNRFAKHALRGEWFRGDIYREVMEIINNEAANPQPQMMNVIVAGDSEAFFVWSSDPQHNADRQRLQEAVFRALDNIHAKTQVAWVITGGERLLEHFAWEWANEHKVEVYRYHPKWKKHGRFAGFKVGPKLLRAMFDPKLLLVFVGSKVSSSTQSLIRRAEKAGIEVVRIYVGGP